MALAAVSLKVVIPLPMALAAVRFKVVILLLFIHCMMLLPFDGFVFVTCLVV